MTRQYDALALFSGGLDSILAVKVIQDQGLKVLGLHFVTPFFGKEHLIPFWAEHYGVEVEAVDINEDYVDLVVDGPPNEFGKWLNPCIDCKIMMVAKAKELMAKYGAKFLISGEVVGQRPMSQRKDAMNRIKKCAEAHDVLLRPLSALNLDPTPVEESGLVDRSKLLDLKGRSRKPQLAMAEEYGFTEIPTPAGGCVLAESESSARFVRVMQHTRRPSPDDFRLCQVGRHGWAGPNWLVIGRNKDDNTEIGNLARPADIVFKVKGFPGPLAIGRVTDDAQWDRETLVDAASFMASYCSKGKRHAAETGEKIPVLATYGGSTVELLVTPERKTALAWQEPKGPEVKEWKINRFQDAE